MNKDEAVSFLRKKGYQAENNRGVVTVIYDRTKILSEYKQILSLLREHGYQASFGMKAIVSNINQSEESSGILEEDEVQSESENMIQEEKAEDLEDFDADEEDEEVDSSQLSFFENGNGQLSFL